MAPRKSAQANARLRRIEVAKLLVKGWSYREMADMLEVSDSTIGRDVGIIMKNWAEEMKPAELHNWLLKELRKLDRMEKGLAEASENGDVGCIDRRIRLMERRAKLLGLDSAIKISIKDADIDKAIEKEIGALKTTTGK